MLGLINYGTVFAFHRSVFLPETDVSGARSAFCSTSSSLCPLAALFHSLQILYWEIEPRCIDRGCDGGANRESKGEKEGESKKERRNERLKLLIFDEFP